MITAGFADAGADYAKIQSMLSSEITKEKDLKRSGRGR